MLWEVELRPLGDDPERDRASHLYDQRRSLPPYPTASSLDEILRTRGTDLIAGTARGYLLAGDLTREQVERLLGELLIDPLVETGTVHGCDESGAIPHEGFTTILPKPGVMDPVAQTVETTARDMGFAIERVRTFRRYFCPKTMPPARYDLFPRLLANDAIEEIVEGPITPERMTLGRAYVFRLVTVPIGAAGDDDLRRISRDGQLALDLAEMRAIQAHFRALGREPTDIELETLAQTWSEHCSHKTLKGPIDYTGPNGTVRRIHNLLKETIFAATRTIRERLGVDDWCVSVFADNAGVVKFDDQYHACFKVETHNHPSAIEPYGGANTGLGGVIRDVLGTGLAAKPIANSDVFCFAPPDFPLEKLPPGVLPPGQVMRGVVAGVRDYGNRMGIPTVNGAVVFDERYLANPLVFCGTVGLLPVDRVHKQPRAGDLIVALGGRTGRDGIHGATFSSLELTAESESVSGGAVQIGNAITEKQLLDVLLQARDRGLYRAVTDCGAGGFSSAVGEMADGLGARVQIDRAPLKYEGLSYTEIWISEAQERMVLAVPPEHWSELHALCRAEDVEAAVLGEFEATGRLRLDFGGANVADLDLAFLHDGRPAVVRQATAPSPSGSRSDGALDPAETDFNATLRNILASPSVCSKEAVVRQYDHEVQGGTVIKPLVGVRGDGPGDAAAITPVLGSPVGLAIGCGINPRYGDLDPAAMAAAAIDEAVRNVVAVGADPARVALLDNFCWGHVGDPALLGGLVAAAEACRDVAVAYGTPFISGKDSLNNEYRSGPTRVAIPGTLLVSALGRIPDVRRCVTMDLKEAGNELYLLGATRDEMGGSHYHLVRGLTGGTVPRVDVELAPRLLRGLHAAITRGLVRSCHDLSEGGLAVAAAEMAFAGEVGADLTDARDIAPELSEAARLFGESPTRFLLEVKSERAEALRGCFPRDVPLTRVGRTVKEARLRIAGQAGEWVVWANLAELKEAWQRTLRE